MNSQFLWDSVNALSRAHVISTLRRMKRAGESGGVSMPYLGLTSFLRDMSAPRWGRSACVNALSRAHVISTKSKRRKKYD